MEGSVDDYFLNKKRFFQEEFYIRQRKDFRILVDESCFLNLVPTRMPC